MRNLDTVDRIVRGVSGVWLLAVAASAFRAGRRTAAATAGVAGVGLLLNAGTGFCGGNALFGVDTDAGSRSDSDEPWGGLVGHTP